MCGISGFLGKGSQSILEAMADSMKHRGPDDEGFYLHDQIGLAFRRMSVIDVNGGHQPIISKCSNSICMVNGEIYNFKKLREELLEQGHIFYTNSDSEVVIHGYEQWDTNVFSKLDGMFAIAIWDVVKKKLILARDPLGKKPLHYYQEEKNFYFASEIKSILKVIPHKLDLDRESIFEYFAFDSVGNEKTIYENVYKVNNGSYIEIKNNLNIEKNQYWKPKFLINKVSYKESLKRIDQALNQAVEKRLKSDVPLGIFLSSGIDSALVAALIAKKSDKKIETYTFGFCETTYDESSEAKEISSYLGLKNNLIKFDELKPEYCLDFIVDQLDEPLNDPAYIPQYLMSKEAKKHIDVVLTGDGGDELFLGYQHFKPNLVIERLKKLKLNSKIFSILLSKIPSSDAYFDLGFKAQRLARGIKADNFWDRDLYFRGAFNPDEIENLFKESHFSTGLSYWSKRLSKELNRIENNLNFFQKLTYLYAMTYLRDTVLVKVDRATMRNGLEARSPYLDKNLFEIVNSIDPKFRSKKIGSKKILKDIAINYLPKKLLASKKHGFGVPVSKWLKTELKSQLLHFSDKNYLHNQGLFDSEFIEKMISKHLSGRYDYRKELWGFLIFQRWYEKNGY